MQSARIAAAAAAFALLGAIRPAEAQLPLRTYQTRYYTLHTDLDERGAREAELRITLMAEEYHNRTSAFAGTIGHRLPFYLFGEPTLYYAHGGRPGSSGVYMGTRLMALAHPTQPEFTWHVVQHEGFHQFVHATIGADIPLWANEGMAEYFGEGVFTGDDFIVGLIPPERLKRVRAGIEHGVYRSLRDMMMTTPEIWNTVLKTENYDQAWSMVHFLAHADEGRYQAAFAGFLRDVSRKVAWEQAWIRNMGGNVGDFELRWKEYWTELPENPTANLHARVAMSIVNSFYARALSQRQEFDTLADFLAAAEAGTLKSHEQDWLPPSLRAVWSWRRASETGHSRANVAGRG